MNKYFTIIKCTNKASITSNAENNEYYVDSEECPVLSKYPILGIFPLYYLFVFVISISLIGSDKYHNLNIVLDLSAYLQFLRCLNNLEGAENIVEDINYRYSIIICILFLSFNLIVIDLKISVASKKLKCMT